MSEYDPLPSDFPEQGPTEEMMSAVVGFAQDTLDRIEQLLSGIKQMLEHEQSGGDGWWDGWKAVKTAYYEQVDNRK